MKVQMLAKEAAAPLYDLPAWRIAAGVRSREFSATAVAEVFLQRIEKLNPLINAFTWVTAERALQEARTVDAKLAAGVDPGPLAGVPFSAKNLFDLRGVVTLAGSRILADAAPAVCDATSVERLCAAGALCLGATNMGEFAYDFTTTNAHYGATHNPLDPARSAGGSSGGSAASVLASLCALSLGTDTNGSMRVPASFCGQWSLKPGYGCISRAGSFPFVTSLDTIGVFGKSVLDLALAFDAMSGPDPRDPVCNSKVHNNTAVELDAGTNRLRLARLDGYFAGKGDHEIQQAVLRLCGALQVTDSIELPMTEVARAAAFVITAAEGGALHRERLRERAVDFDPATRARFLAGALTPATWYLQAQRFRSWWRTELTRVFEHVDVLIAPATPMLAPRLSDKTFMFGDKELALGPNIGLFTQPLTLIGLPVLSVPVQLPGVLPTAIQLVGRPQGETLLLQLARRLERQGLCSSSHMPENNP